MRRDHTSGPLRAALLAPVALAAVACAIERPTAIGEAEVLARPGETAAAVPFHVDYVITPTLLLPGDPAYPARCPAGPNLAATVATGSGRAAHLGQVSEMESNCIDFATLSLTQGELTLTAANGDRVDARFEGSASADPPPPRAELVCSWEITGGTGRFAGATGSGVCVDSRQLGDGRSKILLEGWIRYDARSAGVGRARHEPAGPMSRAASSGAESATGVMS